MSSPDLFVVCKSCGSEVSPYVTECPYCGTRLRKRAPKIERDRGGEARPKPPRTGPSLRGGRPAGPGKARRGRDPADKSTRLSRLRSGEIPGVGADELRRPWATIALVVLSFGLFLSLAFLVRADVALLSLESDPWRYVTAVFLNPSGWLQFAVVVGVGVFGWLLERRHGPVVVLLVFLLAGVGGLAGAEAIDPEGVAYGSQGGALGLLAAWAMPVLLARRHDPEDEADLLGTGVIAAVLLVIPVALGLSVLAGAIGGAVGVVCGLLLAAARPRVT